MHVNFILIAEDEPLPVGHYIDSGARLKVRVEVAHPITTPQEVHEKPEMDTPIEVNSPPPPPPPHTPL